MTDQLQQEIDNIINEQSDNEGHGSEEELDLEDILNEDDDNDKLEDDKDNIVKTQDDDQLSNNILQNVEINYNEEFKVESSNPSDINTFELVNKQLKEEVVDEKKDNIKQDKLQEVPNRQQELENQKVDKEANSNKQGMKDSDKESISNDNEDQDDKDDDQDDESEINGLKLDIDENEIVDPEEYFGKILDANQNQKDSQISSIQSLESENGTKKKKKAEEDQVQQDKHSEKGLDELSVDNIIKQLEEEEEIEKQKLNIGENKNNKKREKEFLNPLDIIEHEEDLKAYNKEMVKEQDNFENYYLQLQKIDINKIPNIIYKPQEVISSKLYLSQENQVSLYGLPRCVTNYQNSYMAIGTSYSLVVIFSIEQQKEVAILGNKNNLKKLGSVTSIDISKEKEALIAGYENGDIIMWDISTQSSIRDITGVQESAILSIKFWKNDKDHIVSSDSVGNVHLLTIKKLFWSYSLDKQRLLPKSTNIVSDIVVLKNPGNLLQNKGVQIIALASLDFVLILLLEPIVKVIKKIEKPMYIRQGLLPCISWGNCQLDDDDYDITEKPYLAIAWGNIITLYQINEKIYTLWKNQTITDNTITGNSNNNNQSQDADYFTLISHYEQDNGILYINWIGNSMLLQLDTRKYFKILYCPLFQKGAYIVQDQDNQNVVDEKQRALVVKNQQIVDCDLYFQTYIKDINCKIRTAYYNSISISLETNDIFIIGFKQTFCGHLYSWTEIIYLLIQENKWNEALKLSLELYYGRIQLFSNHPDIDDSDEFLQYQNIIKNLIFVYLEAKTEEIEKIEKISKKDLTEKWRYIIINTMDFLIGIKNFNLLFNEVKDHFAKNQQKDNFYLQLEYFIMKNQVKNVPHTTYKEIISFFMNRNRLQTVQSFIINLDIEKIDIGYTITLCNETSMFTPLIYICTHKDRDFITPLSKMYQAFKNYIDNNPEKARKFAYKCLWYIRMTLNGIIYPNYKIEYDKYPLVIRQLVIWVLESEVLIQFAKSDSEVLFEVLFKFFEGDPKLVLKDFSTDLFKYFSGDEITGQFNAFYFHKAIINKINNSLAQVMTSHPLIKYNFSEFIGRIAMLGEHVFEMDICFKCIRSILTLEDVNQQDEDVINKRSQYMASILKIIDMQLTNGDLMQQQLNDILNLSAKTGYDEIGAFINYLKGNITDSFDAYLQLKSQDQFKYRVFEWMEYAFVKLEKRNRQGYQALCNYFIKKIKELVQISAGYAKKILVQKLNNREEEALQQLNEYPVQLLQLIEELLQDRKNGKKFDNKILIQYISLLCQLDPDKLLQELTENEYPAQEVLDICKMHQSIKVVEAQAFLSEKLGFYEKALDLYIEIFRVEIQKCIQKVLKGNSYLIQPLRKRYDKLVEICKTNSHGNPTQNQKMWYKLAENILIQNEKNQAWPDLISQISDNNKEQLDSVTNSNRLNSKKQKKVLPIHKFIVTFSEIIADLLLHVSKYVSIGEVIILMNQFQDIFSIKELRDSLRIVLENYHQELKIIQLTHQQTQLDLIALKDNFLHQSQIAQQFDLVCKFCGADIGCKAFNNVILLQCHHSFHKKCIGISTKCQKCPISDAIQIEAIIFELQKTKDVLQQQKVEEEQKNEKQEKTQQEPTSSPINKLNLDVDVKKIRLELKDKQSKKLILFDQQIDEFFQAFDELKEKYVIIA